MRIGHAAARIGKPWSSELAARQSSAVILCVVRLTKLRWCGPSNQQLRWKSQATVRLDETHISDGRRENASISLQDEPIYPTVVRQARENMQKYGDCVVVTRVGSFYELYFEQAEKYGPLLNLKVAQKSTAAGAVPMAGFPFYQLDRFLKVLVQDLNEHVAISEEFANTAPDRAKSSLLFDRRVARVVTPGTLIDEKFMDPYENNFLLAVHVDSATDFERQHKQAVDTCLEDGAATEPEVPIGLAWLDLSTGDFFVQQSSLRGLSTVASRIGPKEVILNCTNTSKFRPLEEMFARQGLTITQTSSTPPTTSIESWSAKLEAEMPSETSSMFSELEISAGNVLLSYVEDRLHSAGISLQAPIRREEQEFMRIDADTLKALEVLTTSKEGYGKGSLLHSVRRTVTRSGTRLLRDWISSPSMSLQTINARLDLVSSLLQEKPLIQRITALLKRTSDTQRLLQKFSMGRGDADDLISLAKTVAITQEVALHLLPHGSSIDQTSQGKQTLSWRLPLHALHQRFSLNGPEALAEVIQHSIDEQGLLESRRQEAEDSNDIVVQAKNVLQRQGSAEDRASLAKPAMAKAKTRLPSESDGEDQRPWIVKSSASHVLERLHEELNKLQTEKVALAARLKEERNAQSLTLRWTPGLGHICHVKGKVDHGNQLSPTRLLKATKSTTSFHDPQWSKLGAKLDQARVRIRAEEHNVLQDIRSQVITNLISLRRNAVVLDELDIACSCAALATEQQLVRPKLNTSQDHRIVGGRHPTVQVGLTEQGRSFVSNDCFIGEKERIWLITGPNMAGKSTFLRQNALISILAQAGCFVPAESATIGLVDQIFTRVGSADNLFKDQSTFMVEMIETAAILKHATPRSLVIMDEIGRGTTPEDGIAIGFACLDHLYHTNRCRTLFATHFHTLADMTKSFEHLGCYCTDLSQDKGTFSFIHRLRPGVNRSSHALKVAALAGVPEAAIETAQKVLSKIGPRQTTAVT